MNREEEARRALNRLDTESEKMLGVRLPDQPTDDPIEILGKRIARIISVFLAAGLMFYLWFTYLSQ